MMMCKPARPAKLVRHAALLTASLLAFAAVWLPAQNTTQALVFAGLRTAAMQGQFNAARTDAAGNLYLLLDQKDGVRLLKTDANGSAILAQALLGAKGDIGTAMALDPAGNVYVAGTTTSASLAATAGAAFPNRTDSSTNSFVARFDANLNPVFVTFTGGSRIAAAAVAATADAVFVTGTTYAANLPVTGAGIQQAPAPGSSGNGFVERFSASGGTLVYATYLTGAGGDTTPTAIVADAADDAFIAGSTTASGYPTVAALVPNILSNPSGFLTRLTPAGDALTFSTFIPGPGLTSLAFDGAGTTLLASGSVALGQFPVDTVAAPLAPVGYQVLLRLPLDGSGVISSTALAPGSASFAAAAPGGAVWVDGALGLPLLPLAPLADSGTLFAVRVAPLHAASPIDQTARFGGLPNGNPTFASLAAIPTSLAVDGAGEPIVAGAIQPSASASLLATETYDLPLRNAPTPALPSSIAAAGQTAATCNGSLCPGSAAYLARLNPASNTPALAFSAGDLPFLVLRNLGATTAMSLQLTATGSTIVSNCGATLAPGGTCAALLANGLAGTATATAAGDSQTVTYPAYKATAQNSTVVFAPKELDFGIQTATSAAGLRTITVTNLGTTSQTFKSAIDSSSKTASPFTEASSDCTTSGAITLKLLAPGGTCHITIGFTASTSPASDAALSANWSIGGRDVLLTGYSEAASLSPSANELDFGTQFTSTAGTKSLNLPRYLYLSNNSTTPLSHAPLTPPSGSPFSVTDACPATLLPQSVCRVRVDYLSATTANDSATLTPDNGSTVLLTGQTQPPRGVNGTSVNPYLSVTPTSITFPDPVFVTGVSASTQTVAISNSGSAPFALALTLSGDFTDATSCGATLAGGATCAVTLSFVPSTPGQRTGLLTVTAGAGSTPVGVTLAGTGAAILPANNGTLDQGSTPVGQPSVQFYKIAAPFNALTVTATGPFTVDLIEDNGFGPGSPSASAYGAMLTASCHNCFLAVRFNPQAGGAQTGTLTFSSVPGGTPYVVNLKGAGLATTGLVLTPSAFDFGPVPVNSSSGAMLFTLTNLSAGGAAVTLTPATLTGDFAFSSAATVGPACTGSLAYGASCSLAVSFVPSATGTRTGTLTAGSATATLSGTGGADPGLAINPLALTFANVAGTTATQQTVSLRNTGSAALTVGAPATGTASFTAASGCGLLAPGAGCSVTVSFTPAAATVTDTLSIPVSGTVYTVALNGSYTASSAGLAFTPAVGNYGATAVSTETSARIFTLTNETAHSYTLNVQIPRQFVLTGAPCTTLAANASCSFSVAFLPLDNGAAAGSIVAQATPADGSAGLTAIAYGEGYAAGGGALALSVSGPGNPIAAGSYNFGQVASGQSAVRVFTVTDASATTNLTVRRVSSAPPFLATTSCGATLTPGQSCSVSVTYAPSNQVSAGTASPASTTDNGQLVLESDAVSSPETLNLTGMGGPQAVSSPTNPALLATFALSQGSLSFASTAVGNASATQTVGFTNTGTLAIHVLGFGSTPDFTVTSNCGAVLPGASCAFTVSSTPQTAGIHFASLEIASDAATSLEFVSLISTAAPAPLTVSPAALNFGSVNVGAAASLAVQVTNNSGAPVAFNSVTASGDYSAAGSCPAPGGTLAAGQSCSVQVTFRPTATGTRTSTLAIATNATTLPLTVSLTGTGVQSKLVVTPASLAFGSLVLGASANLSLTLTNNGSAPVTGLMLQPSGDYAVTNPCPATLAAGAACTAQITFTPSAVGPRPAILTVLSSDPGSPLAVPLTGTGILAGGFTLTVDSGLSSSVAVQSGKPASYILTLTPMGTFAGSVALTCAAVQPAQFASCSITPAAVTLNGGPQTSIAAINTITSVGGNARLEHLAPRSLENGFLCLLVPGMMAVWKARRRLRRFLPLVLAVLVVAVAGAVSGCGSPGGDFNTRYSPAGTYQYQVTATSTSGVQITQTVTLNLTVTPR